MRTHGEQTFEQVASMGFFNGAWRRSTRNYRTGLSLFDLSLIPNQPLLQCVRDNWLSLQCFLDIVSILSVNPCASVELVRHIRCAINDGLLRRM